MSWESLSRAELDSMIADGLAEYDDDVRAEWEQIRIEPAKWRCSPWGDEGGGFWAVAIEHRQVLWFNDIEEGFNRSAFSQHGMIDEYWCNQTTFTEVLEQIAQTQTARSTATLQPGSVPPELSGPARGAEAAARTSQASTGSATCPSRAASASSAEPRRSRRGRAAGRLALARPYGRRPRRLTGRAACRSSLRHLELQAKRLLKAVQREDRDAIARVRLHHPRVAPAALKLAGAQRVPAREYGFASWSLLKQRVAEFEFMRATEAEKRLALIDAACAWAGIACRRPGWRPQWPPRPIWSRRLPARLHRGRGRGRAGRAR